MATIRELASSGLFRGTTQHRVAEPSVHRQLTPIDNAEPTGPNIRTSVDVYVSGQYLGKKGKIVEIIQRYSVYVAYGRNTQARTMSQVRETVLNDFQSEYGGQFNVSNVRIGDLPFPRAEGVVMPDEVAPMEFYVGSGAFRDATRTQRIRWEIGSQKNIARTNIGSIRRRYGRT